MANADGIIIVATNFRTLEVLGLLEQELRKPVMSSNQALMWIARRCSRSAARTRPQLNRRSPGREVEEKLMSSRGHVMATKISAGIVVTANDRMEVWQPGYVIVRDGQIVEAGPGAGPEGDFAETHRRAAVS